MNKVRSYCLLMRSRAYLRGIFLLSSLFLLAQGAKAATNWFPIPQFFSTAGQPLAGGQVFTYAAGTTTPQATYTDSTGLVQNANPVILDSTGKPTQGIWLSSAAYKIVVEDSNNNIQWFQDNLVFGSASSTTAFSAITAATNSNAGNFIITTSTWNFTGATALLIPIAAGCVPITSGSICYDSTNNKYVFGQNGSTVSFGLTSPACAANQFVNTPATATAAASCVQPAFSNISGNLALAQTPTGGTSSNFLRGDQTWNQVAFSNLTGTITAGQIPSGIALTSPALTTPTIGGTTITNVPWMVGSARFESNSINASNTNPFFIFNVAGGAITIKEFDLAFLTGTGSCTGFPSYVLYDETTPGTLSTITLANGTVLYRNTPLSISVPNNHVLDIHQSAGGTGCTTTTNGTFSFMYQMQ